MSKSAPKKRPSRNRADRVLIVLESERPERKSERSKSPFTEAQLRRALHEVVILAAQWLYLLRETEIIDYFPARDDRLKFLNRFVNLMTKYRRKRVLANASYGTPRRNRPVTVEKLEPLQKARELIEWVTTAVEEGREARLGNAEFLEFVRRHLRETGITELRHIKGTPRDPDRRATRGVDVWGRDDPPMKGATPAKDLATRLLEHIDLPSVSTLAHVGLDAFWSAIATDTMLSPGNRSDAIRLALTFLKVTPEELASFANDLRSGTIVHSEGFPQSLLVDEAGNIGPASPLQAETK